jgi:His/Glu/Gln/Arg/opine family amino acid ABC transporter permease subunit
MSSISEPSPEQIAAIDALEKEKNTPKPPPLLAVGPIAWIRDNLFSSIFDTIVTIVSVGLAGTIVTGVISWVVFQANWFVIIFNIRQFTMGRYQPDQEWRVQATLLLVALVIGFALAAWSRISRSIATLALVALALTFIIPAAVRAIVPLPESHFLAGEVGIESGSTSELPQPQLGFLGRANETITIRLDDDLAVDDAALSTLNAFADNATNLLRGAAINRLADQQHSAELEALLAEHENNGPTLTAGQLAAYTEELAESEVPDPITGRYALNAAAVEIQITRGTTGEVVGEATLEAGSPELTVTLPDDGWYVIDKTVADEDSIALLAARGIYPMLQRNFSRSGEVVDEESGEVVGEAGRFSLYVRMTDNYTTEEARPLDAEGDNIPFAIVIDNQYRGQNTFSDYLRLFLTPFLNLINVPFLLVIIALTLGYVGARFLDASRSSEEQPRRTSQRSAAWLLAATPVLMFGLIYGIGVGPLPITDTRLWGGLMLTIMLTMVGIIASFPLGVALALGRRSSLPVVSAACTIYIEVVRGVPLITVLFMAQLLVPLVNPALAEVDNVFRAMIGIFLFSAAYLAENVRGGLQSVPPGQEEAAKALGMPGWQVTAFITLPQALRAVIPALVGQFISLFKDTSLVAIVGLIDLTGIAGSVVAQTEFLGLRREVFLFITLVYFVFSFAMAYVSRRIEETGSGAARRV